MLCCTSAHHKLCDWMNQVDVFVPGRFNIIYTTWPRGYIRQGASHAPQMANCKCLKSTKCLLSAGTFPLKVKNNLTASSFCKTCKKWLNYLPTMSDWECPIVGECCRSCAFWLQTGRRGQARSFRTVCWENTSPGSPPLRINEESSLERWETRIYCQTWNEPFGEA